MRVADERAEARALYKAASRLFGHALLSKSVAAALLRARLTRLFALQTVDTPEGPVRLLLAFVRLLDKLGATALGKPRPATAALYRELERIRSRAVALSDASGAALEQTTSRKKPPTKERQGINPFTKEPIVIGPRPRTVTTGVKRAAKKAALKTKRGVKRAAKTKRVVRRASKPKGRGAGARADWSPVLLGVAAPRAVQPAGTFTARFAAYVKALEAEVTAQLTAMAEVEASVGMPTNDQAQWKKGTQVSVRLSGEHFVATPAEALFTWNGQKNQVQFIVKTKAGAPLGKTQLAFEASIGGVSVGFIVVDVMIGKAGKAGLASATSSPYSAAFASYSHEDTERVTDHLSGFNARVRGTNIFMDCLDLRRGEDWQRQLGERIAEADTFLLFWSKAAAKSEWVDWEWRRAYKAKKAMQAFRLDQPQPLLPKELGSLHADDRFQLARRAHAQSRAKRARA